MLKVNTGISHICLVITLERGKRRLKLDPIAPSHSPSPTYDLFLLMSTIYRSVAYLNKFCRQNSPPVGLDSSATITIGDRQFRVDASDLESLARLGSGAYGVVEKMRHKESDTIMAVKVLN